MEEGLKLWGAQHGQAIKAYQQFVRDGLGAGHQDDYYEVKDQRYLGGDNFVEAVCRSIDEQEQASPVKLTMEEVLTDLAKETGLTIRVLLGKGRGRVESRLRAEAAYVGREVGGISLTEAAKYLRRDLSTLSLGRSSDWKRSFQGTAAGRCRWNGSAPGFAKDADTIIK